MIRTKSEFDSLELSDRLALTDLLARHGRWLDEQRFDETEAIFTPDASVSTQSGQARGTEALVAQARRVHTRFAATQHLTSGVITDIDGDVATVRANMVVTFVGEGEAPVATVGERYRFDAVRTNQGWRFAHLELTPVWHDGDLSPLMTAR